MSGTIWSYQWGQTAASLSESLPLWRDLAARGFQLCTRDGQLVREHGSLLMKRRATIKEWEDG